MLATDVFSALYAGTQPADLPPLVRGLLKQCANEELLGWLLDSTVAVSCGEHPKPP
jgi:hypothetical protein